MRRPISSSVSFFPSSRFLPPGYPRVAPAALIQSWRCAPNKYEHAIFASDLGSARALACWRWRPRHRELPSERPKRLFRRWRRNQHARRVRSPEDHSAPQNMNTLLYDLRYGIRMFLKNPGFTFAALITLALGIASSTAIFSVIDGVLLHPLAYPDSEKIMVVLPTMRSTGAAGGAVAPANYIDWAAQNDVFTERA